VHVKKRQTRLFSDPAHFYYKQCQRMGDALFLTEGTIARGLKFQTVQELKPQSTEAGAVSRRRMIVSRRSMLNRLR
jgi:hypothetical protein